MTVDPQIVVAERRAADAKTRLIAGLAALRDHISPAAIATRVASRVKDRGAAALEGSVETVREHRWAAAGIATLAGLLLARKPISALLRGDETSAPDAGLNADTQETSA